MRERICSYIKEKYQVSPEDPWARDTDSAVVRHTDNKKWFALVMNIGRDKLGLQGRGYVDAVNLKIEDRMFRDMLVQQPGIFPAYHMNKEHWITVLLDGTVEEEKVRDLTDASYAATASRKKKEKMRLPKEWIIPANPRFYDIEHAFDNTDLADWKQSSSIKAGDTVFMYVAAPVSAILYRCKAVEVDIPCHYQDENLTITTMMKIKLLHRYDPGQFTFDRLKKEFGIYAVRGPRGVPNSLSHALKEQDGVTK